MTRRPRSSVTAAALEFLAPAFGLFAHLTPKSGQFLLVSRQRMQGLRQRMMDGRVEIDLFPGEPATHGLESSLDPEFDPCRAARSIAVHGRQSVPGPARGSQMSRQAAQRFAVAGFTFFRELKGAGVPGGVFAR